MAHPDRRTALASLAGLGVASLAGCLTAVGRDLPVGERDRSVRDVPAAPSAPEGGTPGRVFAVGDGRLVVLPGNRPHSVWVWNGGAERTVALALSLADDGTVLAREPTLAAGGVVAIDLLEPDTYVLTVETSAASRTVRIEERRFDCNDSATDVVVGDRGISATTVSTGAACGPLSGVGSPL